MEKFEIKGMQLGVLKYLHNKENNSSEPFVYNTFDKMIRFLNIKNRSEFDQAVSNLEKEKFITFDATATNPIYQLKPKGREYISDFNDFEQIEIFNGHRDYTILKFLYLMDEPVNAEFFPDSILSDIPENGMGMDPGYYLRCYIDLETSLLKKYTSINNQQEISIKPLGKKYYEFSVEKNKKDLEILNKPLIHYDLSTHTTGDGNTVITHSDVNRSLNENIESPSSKKLAKKNYKLNKKILIWTIIGIIVTAAVALYIAYG